MSWFDEVTGSNEYERQSWRDSFNGGRAAGDLTGNVNRRLDAERAAFQGATWSGSSTQPSALELARALGATGPAIGHVSTGGGSAHSAGPGNGGVGNPAMPGPGGSRVKVGSNLTLFPDERFAAAPQGMMPKDQQLKRIGIGGQQESLGAISDIGWARTSTGWVPVPSSDVKERLEDNFFMETSWFVRNYAWPMLTNQSTPPDFLDPQYSHYLWLPNEWRHGGSPRFNSDGGLTFTGGGF